MNKAILFLATSYFFLLLSCSTDKNEQPMLSLDLFIGMPIDSITGINWPKSDTGERISMWSPSIPSTVDLHLGHTRFLQFTTHSIILRHESDSLMEIQAVYKSGVPSRREMEREVHDLVSRLSGTTRTVVEMDNFVAPTDSVSKELLANVDLEGGVSASVQSRWFSNESKWSILLYVGSYDLDFYKERTSLSS